MSSGCEYHAANLLSKPVNINPLYTFMFWSIDILLPEKCCLKSVFFSNNFALKLNTSYNPENMVLVFCFSTEMIMHSNMFVIKCGYY